MKNKSFIKQKQTNVLMQNLSCKADLLNQLNKIIQLFQFYQQHAPGVRDEIVVI